MNDPHFSELDGGCRHPGFNSLAAGFGQYDPYPFVVDIMIDGSGSVASSAHAGNQIVRIVTSFFLLKLFFYLFADDRLQTGHHVRIWVRPYGRTDDVIRIRGMAAPVSDGFVRGIFQSHVARSDRNDCRSQHFHLFYIDVLAFYIRFAHVYDALHVHQGTDCGCCHPVLSGTGLRNDTFLTHASCQ